MVLVLKIFSLKIMSEESQESFYSNIVLIDTETHKLVRYI